MISSIFAVQISSSFKKNNRVLPSLANLGHGSNQVVANICAHLRTHMVSCCDTKRPARGRTIDQVLDLWMRSLQAKRRRLDVNKHRVCLRKAPRARLRMVVAGPRTMLQHLAKCFQKYGEKESDRSEHTRLPLTLHFHDLLICYNVQTPLAQPGTTLSRHNTRASCIRLCSLWSAQVPQTLCNSSL